MPWCPYCGSPFEYNPDHIPMSARRREVFDFIREAGPKGVVKFELRDKFFPEAKDNTIRTTLHHINQAIKPLRVVTRGGVVRLLPKE